IQSLIGSLSEVTRQALKIASQSFSTALSSSKLGNSLVAQLTFDAATIVHCERLPIVCSLKNCKFLEEATITSCIFLPSTPASALGIGETMDINAAFCSTKYLY